MKDIRKTEPDVLVRTKPYTEAEKQEVSEIIAKAKELRKNLEQRPTRSATLAVSH